MQNRAHLDLGANAVFLAQGGDIAMSQLRFTSDSTVGSSVISTTALLNGILNRTGSVGAYNATLPTAAQVLAAAPNLSVGDSWSFILRNTVAFAATMVAATGMELGADTAIVASAVREYLLTVLGAGPGATLIARTNTNTQLTNVAAVDIARVSVGQGVTGTGVAANTVIIGLDANQGIIYLNNATTATADNIAITTNPRIAVNGVRSSPL